MTNSFGEFPEVKLFLCIGTNMTEAHPVAATFVKNAVRRGSQLIVVDPRRHALCEHATMFAQIRVGSDIAFLNGMAHVLLTENLYDREYVEARCEGFDELRETVLRYPPERAAEITGVDADLIRAIARRMAAIKPATVCYTLGITEHTCGRNNVVSIANLPLLLGNMGMECGGVNPLRGQNNVQGACDMGALPNVFPGYQYVTALDNVLKFEKAWGVKLSGTPGLTMVEQTEALLSGRAKGMVIFGANPVMSYPDANRVQQALEKAEFLLVQDIFANPASERAHVVLPGASFAEADGTFSCSERRVQRVRKAIEPLCGKANWETIQELSTRLGYPMNYASAEEIFDEMASLCPAYGGMSYPRLDEQGLCWPCPNPDHPGTQYLHKDRFSRGLGLFHGIEFRPPAEGPCADYPFWLTTGTMYAHYLTATMTRHCPSLERESSEVYVEINPADAKALNVINGERIKAATRRGQITAKVMITDTVKPGVVFIPMHYLENAANRLTNAALDPVTKTPEYKVCAVRLQKAA